MGGSHYTYKVYVELLTDMGRLGIPDLSIFFFWIPSDLISTSPTISNSFKSLINDSSVCTASASKKFRISLPCSVAIVRAGGGSSLTLLASLDILLLNCIPLFFFSGLGVTTDIAGKLFRAEVLRDGVTTGVTCPSNCRISSRNDFSIPRKLESVFREV